MTKLGPRRIGDRVLAALALKPMTAEQLARCLSVNEISVRDTLHLQFRHGRITKTRDEALSRIVYALKPQENTHAK